jgi:hypothetical protein
MAAAQSISIGTEAEMWLLALEALVALGMLILIVWLTMAKPRRRDEASKELPPPDASRGARHDEQP